MTKKQAVTPIDLLNAYRILFAQSQNVHLTKIKKLQPDTLRNAYKKLAFKKHPDRARLLGENRANLEIQFKRISSAYFLLDSYMKGKTQLSENSPQRADKKKEGNYAGKYEGSRKKKKKTFTFKKQKNNCREENRNQQRAPKDKESAEKKGAAFNRLPRTELLLGQYLYYCGHITLQNVLEALQWQRKQRPSFGQIAIDWQIITSDDIVSILKNKKYRELFGECAFRLGLINHFQYRAILAKQSNKQLPIGQYFIDKGILEEDILEKLHEDLMLFNKMIRMGRKNQQTGK